ncbi:MAG TPA: SIMPL domain-containing protein [Candidatus Acidoferrales bacterium]|nr:SIMPL domain-containing protein [Candidatus Acidoferrales bacterium]
MNRIVVPLAAAALLAAPVATVAASEPTEIVVTGQATISMQADQAVVEASIETNAPGADDAVGQNNALYDRVVAALEKIGVPRSNISLTYYNVRYQRRPEDESSDAQARTGYFVNRAFTVKVAAGKAGPAIDACESAGNVAINGVNFGIADDRSARSQAMAKAVADAREKAQVLAAAAGLHIVGIKSVDEGGFSTPMIRMMGPARAAPEALPPTQLDQSSVGVSANVNITFLAAP